jgi:tetratricopeptide (TPR) repeat protein
LYIPKKLGNSIAILSFQDGSRSKDPEKFIKEAALLEKELEKDPLNTRNQFYLALSYLKADQKILALKNFEKRLNIQGSDEEQWFSLYSIAKLHDDMNYPSEVVTKEYCLAFQCKPQRVEPLGCLALHHLKKGNFVLAYSIAVQALNFTKPEDCYFVENWHYDFGILCVYADSARCLGLKEQSLKAYNFLLEQKTLPSDVREKVEKALQEMTT